MNSIVVDLSYIIRVFHIQMQDYRKVWQVNDVQVAQKLDIGIFWGGFWVPHKDNRVGFLYILWLL